MASKTADYKAIYKEIGKKNGDHTKAVKKETEEIKARINQKPLYCNPVLFAYRIAKYMTRQNNIEWVNSNGKNRGKPYTISGMYVSTGMSDNTWAEYVSGSKDHIIHDKTKQPIMCQDGTTQAFTLEMVEDEYINYTLFLMGDIDSFDKEPEQIDKAAINDWAQTVFFSTIAQNYRTIVQSQREEDLYLKGRTADIFVHKARYGWQDETVITTKQVLTNQTGDELLTAYLEAKTKVNLLDHNER